MALVRYRTNDYSVPTAYGFQDIVVKGFVEDVVILCAGQEIARHPRSYGEGVFVSNPLHYLALIEMKPNSRESATKSPTVSTIAHARRSASERRLKPIKPKPQTVCCPSTTPSSNSTAVVERPSVMVDVSTSTPVSEAPGINTASGSCKEQYCAMLDEPATAA
jgi:hypothetical protein